jgi:RHS repeat-associated protein
LAYDPEDRLRSVTDSAGEVVASFGYDGLGRRVSSTDNTGERRFVTVPILGDDLDAPHLIVDNAGDVLAGYVYAGEVPLMRLGPDGPVYYLTDGMGSVLGLSDATATLTSRITYDGFGNVLETTGTAPSIGGDFGFHGAWTDATTGLVHLRARDYDPRTGRFLSRDALEPNLHNPESMHPYAFAQGNPHLYRDPTGLFSVVSVNVTMSAQSIMASAQSWAARLVITKVKDAATDIFVDSIVKILTMMVPMTETSIFAASLLDDAAQPWKKFERGIMNFLCDMFGSKNLSWLWFEPVIQENGKPLGNGWSCNGPRDPRESIYRMKKGHREPDFVLNNVGGLVDEPGGKPRTSLLIGEIKIRISTFRKTYSSKRRKGQYSAIVNYAAKNTYSHVALLIALRDGSDKHKAWLLKEGSGLSDGATIPVIVAIGN